MNTLIFKIEGMDCANEVAILKRVLLPIVNEREERLTFDLLNEKLSIKQVENLPKIETVTQAVSETGMTAVLWSDHVSQGQDDKTFWEKNGRAIMAVASALNLGAGLIVNAVADKSAQAFVGEEQNNQPYPPTAAIVLYTASIVAGGWYVFPKALRAVSQFRADIDVLMVTAMIGAAAINQLFEAATVAFLFASSSFLESWNIDRARKAIRALMDLTPPTARVKQSTLANAHHDHDHDHDHDGHSHDHDATLERLESQQEIRELPIEEVTVGATIIVRPGERIPMDSVLISGSTEVNQAPITGESMPVRKNAGDELFAGTINGDNAIECRVTKVAADSALARIIHMVEEAQSRRSESEQFVEKFAKYYTPSMMLFALAVALVAPLATGAEWAPWIYKALVILVISCPCSLVISTPVSIIAGLSAAARAGILIKGGIHLETPARLKAIAFDKTGTLTSGEPTVQQLVALEGQSDAELLTLALALEEHSNHPLARAIRRRAEIEGIVANKSASSFSVFQGKGAEGIVDGKLYWIGSHRLVHEKVGDNEPADVHDKMMALEDSGHSVIAIGHDQQISGFIGVADTLRPECKDAIRDLKQAGIQSVVMLTGDNQGTAKAIAESVKIDEYWSELLPEDKVTQVESLVSRYKYVAMVGDGVNDAPAMAIASLAIAMGAAGSDAAIETADIALMSDDLGKLAWLINHSHNTINVIRQNIAFSVLVKAIFVALAFANKTTLWMAIAADMGTSFIVVFNGLRLLNMDKKHSLAQEQENDSGNVAPKLSTSRYAAVSQNLGHIELSQHDHSHDHDHGASILPLSIFREDSAAVVLSTSSITCKGKQCCHK